MRTARLERRLGAWVGAGLLSAEQAERILALERVEERSGVARWGAWIFGALGAVAVAVGLVSLVAANWDDIPAGVKLACGLVLLLGVLGGAAALGSQEVAWARSLLLVLHVGLVLGMIGLVAQVYHLSGAAWRPFALTAALALPAAAVARHALVADLALLAGLGSLGLYLAEAGWLERAHRGDFRFGLAAGCVGLACFGASRLLAAVHPGAAGALRRWGCGVGLLATTWAAVLWSEPRLEVETGSVLPALLLALAAALGGLQAWRPERGRAARWACVALGTALVLGPGVWEGGPPVARQVVGFVLFVGAWAAFAAAAAEAGHAVGVNVATLAVAGRLLALYLELVEDLLTTGLGLIATGLVLAAIGYGWWRLRRLLPLPAARAAGGAP